MRYYKPIFHNLWVTTHTCFLTSKAQINCLECQSHYYMVSVNYSFHLNLPYGIHSMSTVRFKVLHFIHTFPCGICMPSYYRGTRFFEIPCLIHFCFGLNLILNLANMINKGGWISCRLHSLLRSYIRFHLLLSGCKPYSFRTTN